MTIRLKAYYETNKKNFGMSESNIARNLELLPNDLSHAFREDAEIEVVENDLNGHNITLSIRSDLPREAVVRTIENALSQSQLYGTVE